jgi:hypothetical protein
MLLGLIAIVTGIGAMILGGAMFAGSVPADPIMLAVLVIAGVCSAICGYLATQGGAPVEMPGGETIFDAPRQPERPSPHRTLDE